MIPRCEMRESEMQCFLDTRALKQASHQGKSLTKASKPPNSKYLLLVEVHRAESLVDEVVGPLQRATLAAAAISRRSIPGQKDNKIWVAIDKLRV